jgi:hypothetical protein
MLDILCGRKRIPYGSHLKECIWQLMSQKYGGEFLWAALAVKQLRRFDAGGNVLRALKRIPEDSENPLD